MAAIQPDDPRLQGLYFFGKFALDVIHYNLQAFGFDQQVVLLNSPPIEYHRPNFVKIAAVSVLRLCLSYRDVWKENIQNLITVGNSVFDCNFFIKCLFHIVEKTQYDGKETLQLNTEVTLAISTEMALCLISENKKFDLVHLSASVSVIIFLLIENPVDRIRRIMYDEPPVNYRQELENLFPEFRNIWGISRWINEFIRRYAVSYRSRHNLSAVFYREVGRRWREIVEDLRGENPSDELVMINLGFLPRFAYYDIVNETPVTMPRYSRVGWGRKPPRSPASPVAGAVGGNLSSLVRSIASVCDYRQGGHSSEDSSEQASQGGQPGKESTKTARDGKGSKDSSVQATQGSKSSKESSEQAAQGSQSSKESSEQGSQGSKDSFDQAAQGSQSSKESSDQGGQSNRDSFNAEVAEALRRMSLDSERNSQASKGAVSKRRKDARK